MKATGGWAVWALMLLLAWTLPGRVWRPASIPSFPVQGLVAFLALLAALVLLAPLPAARGGRGPCRSRLLATLEAPPPLLWGMAVLALWPAAWGPPGWPGGLLAFLLGALPTEVRWLAQAMPAERPFPAAWGAAALARSRRRALAALLPHWLAARLPVWLMSTLVIERVLGQQGLGSDWTARFAARDRPGLTLWVAGLAGLWTVTRRRQDP